MRNLICLPLLLIFFFSTNLASAQETSKYDTNSQLPYETQKVQSQEKTVTTQKPKPVYPRHWSFGGWFSMSFWNGGTDIMVAPKAYYHVSPKFLTGFGITYIYSDSNDELFDYHSNSIGGSLMMAVRPIPAFQLSMEYEGLNTTRIGFAEDTFWNNALFLGASFVQGPVSFGVRYDILYDEFTSAFGSAWTPFIGFYF